VQAPVGRQGLGLRQSRSLRCISSPACSCRREPEPDCVVLQLYFDGVFTATAVCNSRHSCSFLGPMCSTLHHESSTGVSACFVQRTHLRFHSRWQVQGLRGAFVAVMAAPSRAVHVARTVWLRDSVELPAHGKQGLCQHGLWLRTRFGDRHVVALWFHSMLQVHRLQLIRVAGSGTRLGRDFEDVGSGVLACIHTSLCICTA
jgi:hypothetical protein